MVMQLPYIYTNQKNTNKKFRVNSPLYICVMHLSESMSICTLECSNVSDAGISVLSR